VRTLRDQKAGAPLAAAFPYISAAALVLAAAGPWPTTFRFGIPGALLTAGFGRAAGVHRRRELRRAEADAWLIATERPNPSAFAWRIEELIAEKATLGQTVRAIAEDVTRPKRPGGLPVADRMRLRPHTPLLFELADALQNSLHTSPKAIARTGQLISHGGSPLNCSANHGQLRETLKSILADINSQQRRVRAGSR
jgi:hypothetical protein